MSFSYYDYLYEPVRSIEETVLVRMATATTAYSLGELQEKNTSQSEEI
ncbi:MAG: hypothetical protein WBM77_14785 [Maribacter sp.]